MAAVCRPAATRTDVAAPRQRATIFFLAEDPPPKHVRPMPAPLTPQPPWHHLPRLAPEFYRAFSVVLWTITLEHRATGWLDDLFHARFRELLLHAAAREGLFCPKVERLALRAVAPRRRRVGRRTGVRLWTNPAAR